MANPYERMITCMMLEAEDGVFDEQDEPAIAFFSEGESEEYCDDDVDDDVEEIEDDEDDD